jgi:hypothetical protein
VLQQKSQWLPWAETNSRKSSWQGDPAEAEQLLVVGMRVGRKLVGTQRKGGKKEVDGMKALSLNLLWLQVMLSLSCL